MSCLLHTSHFINYTYLYSYVARKSLIYTSIHMHLHVHCNWCIHKSATPFWVAARYVQAWKRARDITLQHVHWFAHVPVWWNIHSLLTQNYHIYKDGWSIPIDQVLYCEQEIGNCRDPCTVVVKSATVGRPLLIIILSRVKLNHHKFISSK